MNSKNILITLWVILFFSCKQIDFKPNLKGNETYIKYSDEELLNRVQQECINYIWQGEEPISGGARERIHMDHNYPQNDSQIVTSGGTGFGILAIIVGIERGFIKRDEGVKRLTKLTHWLNRADRFHGAWSHWLLPTGKAQPFSKYDDGGDIVETAYLAQGLIVAREYFKNGNTQEKSLSKKCDELWKGIDWSWYTNGDQEVLYWHWSPNYEWKMNFAIKGYNECLILYVLGACSPTHGVDPKVYHNGFMRNGQIITDRKLYEIPTVLDHYDSDTTAVGPLFWAHYSYLGLDPRNLKDQYADWWKVNQNHALIHYKHCVLNPNHFKGYSDKCWGLTSSYSMEGYDGHNPQHDLGVISPTAALCSFPYTPEASLKFLHYLYEEQPNRVGVYGPYDAFSMQYNWMLPHYLAIDQLPIPVMIENYRSGFIWNLFMKAEEVKSGLTKLGFTY